MAKTKREQLEKLVADMRALADECDAKDGGPDAADREKLAKMATDVNTLVEDIKSEATVTGTLDVAKAFLGELAGKTGSTEGIVEEKDGIVNPKGMTLGEALVASPAYEDFIKQFKGNDGRIREVTGIKSSAFEVASLDAYRVQKDLITGADPASAGAFLVPQRLPGVTDLVGQRELTLRQLCTVIPVTGDSFEYVQVNEKTSNAATVGEASTADDINGSTVTSVQGGLKPMSDIKFRVVNSTIETIAHLVPITRRATADAPQVRAIVDAFLLTGLDIEEENQILNGDGTSPNLKGILDYQGGDTDVDDIRIYNPGVSETDIDSVVGAIRTLGYSDGRARRRATGMVVSPLDWFSDGFLLAKNGVDGGYLIGDPRASVDQLQQLWGLKVVVSEAMQQGDVLVGDFRQAVVADRQQGAIYITDSHKDWFQRNLLAILAEKRVGFGLLDPGAFVLITPAASSV